MRRVILHLNYDSDGIVALRAAQALIRDGYESCGYSYGDTLIYAYKTKTGVTAREQLKSDA